MPIVASASPSTKSRSWWRSRRKSNTALASRSSAMTERVVTDERGPAWRRAAVALRNEVVGLHPRLHAYNLAVRLLPARASGELRARLLRLVGFSVGTGTSIEGELRLTGDRRVVSRLAIGRDTTIGGECTFDLL